MSRLIEVTRAFESAAQAVSENETAMQAAIRLLSSSA